MLQLCHKLFNQWTISSPVDEHLRVHFVPFSQRVGGTTWSLLKASDSGICAGDLHKAELVNTSWKQTERTNIYPKISFPASRRQENVQDKSAVLCFPRKVELFTPLASLKVRDLWHVAWQPVQEYKPHVKAELTLAPLQSIRPLWQQAMFAC